MILILYKTTMGWMTNPLDTIGDRLETAGVRFTPARRSVVEALGMIGGPISAQELQSRLDPPVPISSLYRTLAVLAETEVVSSHHGPHGITRYELAEWLAGHHHHTVCSSCGDVTDVEVASHHEERLERIVAEAAALIGFAADGHSLEVEGLCARCRP